MYWDNESTVEEKYDFDYGGLAVRSCLVCKSRTYCRGRIIGVEIVHTTNNESFRFVTSSLGCATARRARRARRARLPDSLFALLGSRARREPRCHTTYLMLSRYSLPPS